MTNAPAGPIPLKGLRGAIARNVSEGWQAPQVAIAVDVDMSRARDLVAGQGESGDVLARVTLTAVVLRALAQTLRAHPRLNGWVRDGVVELAPAVHLGLAVALEDGLMVPVIRHAETLSLEELAAESRRLADGARKATLVPREYQGGSFTLSNLGGTGIDWFTPILQPPQIAILGLGRVAERPVLRNSALAAIPNMTAVLVFDHRAVDGDPAARFLKDFAGRLESAGET